MSHSLQISQYVLWMAASDSGPEVVGGGPCLRGKGHSRPWASAACIRGWTSRRLYKRTKLTEKTHMTSPLATKTSLSVTSNDCVWRCKCMVMGWRAIILWSTPKVPCSQKQWPGFYYPIKALAGGECFPLHSDQQDQDLKFWMLSWLISPLTASPVMETENICG